MDAVKYKLTIKETGEVIEVLAHGSGEDNGVLYTEFSPLSESGTDAWENNPTLYRFLNDGTGALSSELYDIVKDEA